MEMTYANQFDDEPIEQLPDPNKGYYLIDGTMIGGYTYLLKLLWLIVEYPTLVVKRPILIDLQPILIGELSEHIKNNNQTTYNMALYFVLHNYKSDIFLEVLEIFIKCGTSVNYNINFDWRNMHQILIICSQPADKLPEIVNLLIKYGVDVNTKYDNSSTLLDYCCRHYNLDKSSNVAHILINEGVNLGAESIIKLNKCEIYDAIITRNKHYPQKIQPFLQYLNDEQIKLLESFKQFKISIQPVTNFYNEFYYHPRNIGALLCESNFYIKSDNSRKLTFLFNSKKLIL